MHSFEKKICVSFGSYLKDSRNDSLLTQNEVAEACGHSNAQFISNIERGTCWPPMNVLSKMSKLYKIPRHELLDRFTECRRKIWAYEMGIRGKKAQ